MRSFSTPQSVLNLEITKLAIVECIVAIAVYVGIGVYLGTFRHLAWAVVVAPLMLFRTEASAEWGLEVYGQINSSLVHTYLRIKKITQPVELISKKIKKISERNPLKSLPWALLLLLLFPVFVIFYFTIFMVFNIFWPVVGITIRILGTLYWTVRRPIYTLKETPQNWLRQSLCTDFCHPPEIIPLEAARGDKTKIFTFSDTIESIHAVRGIFDFFIVILSVAPLLLIGYIPSFFYRITFKATMLAYAPFIFVVHTTLKSQLSLKVRLQRITKGEIEKVRRWFSGIVVFTLAAKAGLMFGWVDPSYLTAKFPGKGFVESLVLPQGLPWWQVILGIDAALTFFLLFFADAALDRIDSQVWPDNTVAATVSSVSFVRASLGLATMAYFFHIALVKVAASPMLGLLPA